MIIAHVPDIFGRLNVLMLTSTSTYLLKSISTILHLDGEGVRTRTTTIGFVVSIVNFAVCISQAGRCQSLCSVNCLLYSTFMENGHLTF